MSQSNVEIFNEFVEHIRSLDNQKVNIVIHDAPDPDAVGSAVAVQAILKDMGIKSEIFYGGDISHPQNKTIVNLLNITMNKTTSDIEGNNICIDCTPNNSRAKDALFVVDHHKSTYSSQFSIQKPNFGASATIVWNLIKDLDIEISNDEIDIYSALLLGIRTDTNDLISENMTQEDFIAYQELLDKSDKETIQKVMNYPLPRYLYEKRTLLHTEGNSSESNGIFVGGIGFISSDQRDAIAILAEEYARMESVTTAIIFAITNKTFLEVSVRSSNVSLDVNQLCKDLFGNFGGGKASSGGAKIPLNFYGSIDEKHSDSFWKITCRHMFRKVLKESWNDNGDS